MSVVDRLVKAISRKDIDAYASLYANEAVMYEPLLPEPARGKREIMEAEAGSYFVKLGARFQTLIAPIRNRSA